VYHPYLGGLGKKMKRRLECGITLFTRFYPENGGKNERVDIAYLARELEKDDNISRSRAQ
jgi:hypothetical protein